MGSLNDDDITHTIASTLYSDEEGKHPITWDKNTASITGTLAIVGRAIRSQKPKLHKLVVTGTVEERGITYIDNPAKINFLEEPSLKALDDAENYSFDKPCPSTAYKTTEVNDALTLAGKDEREFTTADTMTLTDGDSSAASATVIDACRQDCANLALGAEFGENSSRSAQQGVGARLLTFQDEGLALSGEVFRARL